LERRIAQAQTMLADPDMPVKTVARKLGYDDPDYFSRLFRSITGKSIREWRRELGLSGTQCSKAGTKK
jgi:AraC-like DNA-binding protein